MSMRACVCQYIITHSFFGIVFQNKTTKLDLYSFES